MDANMAVFMGVQNQTNLCFIGGAQAWHGHGMGIYIRIFSLFYGFPMGWKKTLGGWDSPGCSQLANRDEEKKPGPTVVIHGGST